MKVYNYLLNVSIITRWTLYIIPILALLWIPGILSFTAYPHATVWGVRLLWWSIWLTVVWVGWWAARAVSLVLPHMARHTIGIVAVGARRYIDWLQPLGRYIALFAWSLAVWVSFNPLVNTRREPGATAGDAQALSTAARIFFAVLESAVILLAEKVAIQTIATKFHERSYAERVAAQKFAVRTLVTLYRHSSDIPWRSDTLKEEAGDGTHARRRGRFLKRALHGVKVAATTTTTALGNVASEIAGSSVLQPNSPQAVIKTVLESANKSRQVRDTAHWAHLGCADCEYLVGTALVLLVRQDGCAVDDGAGHCPVLRDARRRRRGVRAVRQGHERGRDEGRGRDRVHVRHAYFSGHHEY